MSLRYPGLGPLVGHTTPNSARIWIRADDPLDQGADLAATRRTIGVIAKIEENGNAVKSPELFYFRLHRQFDRTGTINFGEELGIDRNWHAGTDPRSVLKPDTRYALAVGTLTIDDPFGNDETVTDSYLADRLPEPGNLWPDLRNLVETDRERCTAEFATFPSPRGKTSDSLAFIVGSCRYPGLLWKTKEADAIFGPLRREATGDDKGARHVPTAFNVMLGDQIYADMLNRHVPIGLADTYEEFQDRYIKAFGSHHMRHLLRRVPTYMILDDHEIEDNWSQDRLSKAASRRVFNIAIGAYMSYQWSHSPRSFGRRLYYNFECGGYPFFVLDTRTQRFMDDVEESLEDNHLLGRPAMDDEEPSQLERLLMWLEDCQQRNGDVPKFIVTSSVFAPNPMSARTGRKHEPRLKESDPQMIKWMEETDSWPAFPETRRKVLRCILDKKIQNVVFVSGDIHCSNVAELSFSGSPEVEALKAFSITSSAFYWPFFFADGDPSNFVHDSTKPEQSDTFLISETESMDYKSWNFTQDDNFCRIDIDRKAAQITIQPFDTKGEPIAKRDWLGKPTKRLTSKLKLAPW